MSGSYNITDISFQENYFKFCDKYTTSVLIWAGCNMVTALIGFPASVAVLWELLQRYRRGTPTTPNDVFMINLTIMDFVFLSILPFGVCNFFTLGNWTVECFFNFVYGFYATGRPLFMSCICLDCYLAVVHPITYRARKGLTSRVLMSIGVWAVTVVHGIIYIIYNTDMPSNPVTPLPFVFAILTIGVCDFFILRALKSSDPAGRDLHPQKKKACQIIINSLVMSTLAYLPQLFLFITGKVTSMSAVFYQCLVSVPFLCLTASASAVMPLLYLSNLGKLDHVWLWCHKSI